MERTQIKNRAEQVLRAFLAHRGHAVTSSELKNLKSVGLDSLSMAELIFEICEAFGIDDRLIRDDQLRSITSLDSLVEAIEGILPVSAPN